jgi:hypothetical protein
MSAFGQAQQAAATPARQTGDSSNLKASIAALNAGQGEHIYNV